MKKSVFQPNKSISLFLLAALILSLSVISMQYLLLRTQKIPSPASQANPPSPALQKSTENIFEFPSNTGAICRCPIDGVQQVCGVDFSTYSSSCEADCYQVPIAYLGTCKIYNPTLTIPSFCNECSIACPKDQTLFLDAKGCPVCECKPAPYESGEEHL